MIILALVAAPFKTKRRFYRSDKSRRTEGLGLGLSLVAAILKLHGFQFAIAAGPGCTVEIVCPPARKGESERSKQQKLSPKITAPHV